MFDAFKQRFRDIRTINSLFVGAEKLANADGQKEPGAEHFVQMALELPDGTARKAFRRIQADPDSFRAAIARQYEEALRNVGVTLPPDGIVINGATSVPAGTNWYKAQPSVQALMKTIYEINVKEQKTNPATPLLGAHVLLAATTAQYGVAMRTFRAMGIDPEKLADAAKEEIIASRMT